MLRPIAVAVLIGLPSAAFGTTPPPAESAPPAAEAPAAGDEGSAEYVYVERTNAIDTTRKYLHDAVEWVAHGVDELFGDKPFEKGGRVAGAVGLSFLWRQDEGFDWLTRFRVRLDLPNIRERAYIFVGRDNEKEVVSDRPEGFTRREQLLQETREDQSFFAGVGAQVAEVLSLRAGLRGGFKPYTQARYRDSWDLTRRDAIELTQTLFWTLDDGFGSTTALNYGHLFEPSLALRWNSAATWAQYTDGVAWASSLGLYKDFGFQRQLSLEGLINGQTGGEAEVSEYGLRARWEQPVYKDWLLGELILGYFWPRKDTATERGQAWAIGAGLVMRF